MWRFEGAVAIALGATAVLLGGIGCGGDSADADEAGDTAPAAATGAEPSAADEAARLALSVQVPQYVDDIKSGANPGGREGATDKLIAILQEHRAALGDEQVARTLRESADYVRQFCPECAAELEAELERVEGG